MYELVNSWMRFGNRVEFNFDSRSMIDFRSALDSEFSLNW